MLFGICFLKRSFVLTSNDFVQVDATHWVRHAQSSYSLFAVELFSVASREISASDRIHYQLQQCTFRPCIVLYALNNLARLPCLSKVIVFSYEYYEYMIYLNSCFGCTHCGGGLL